MDIELEITWKSGRKTAAFVTRSDLADTAIMATGGGVNPEAVAAALAWHDGLMDGDSMTIPQNGAQVRIIRKEKAK